MRGLRVFFLAAALVMVVGASALAAEDGAGKEDLQKVAQEASNPVGQLWMLTNQFNVNLLQSETLEPFESRKSQFVWNFQPVMPLDLSDEVRLILRPVIPIENVPYVAGRNDVQYKFGLGDVALQALFAPNTTASSGFMWGVGPTAVFPTATDEVLGKGKWQLGGAFAGLFINSKWVVGVFPQHWWSVGGSANRKDVSFSNIQYFIWYSPIPTWQIGMSPNAYVDWMQDRPEDRLTLPIGLGVAKTFRLGKMPIKVSCEVDYAVIRPRNIPGNEWTFRINFTPIIRKLF